jgi:hypothetical protein
MAARTSVKAQILGVVSVLAFLVAAPEAGAVTVNGTDDIFAAGLTSIPDPMANGDQGTLPQWVAVAPGETFNVTASGTVVPSTGGLPTGPDGYVADTSDISDSLSTGFANYNDPNAFALAGVYTDAAGDAIADNQVFRIGASDTLTAPTDAARLYLGFADAGGFNGSSGLYTDNSGSLQVSISAVPESSSWALMILGFGAMGMAARRRGKMRKALAPA